MIGGLPDLLYNIGSKSLDPDFLLVKNIWKRAEILREFKSQVSLFVEDNVQDVRDQKMLQLDCIEIHFITGLYLL